MKVLECRLRSNPTLQTNLWGERGPLLTYYFQFLSLAHVGLWIFPLHRLTLSTIGLGTCIIWWVTLLMDLW